MHYTAIRDKCTADLSEHVAIGLVDHVAFHEVTNALDPAQCHAHHVRVGHRLTGAIIEPIDTRQ